MLLTVDTAGGGFDHACEGCHTTRRGLHVGTDLTVGYDAGAPCNLIVPCPCGVIEIFRLVAPAEAGEGRHPDSLVGRRFPDTGGVVSAHNVDGSEHPHHREQARLILALARHPRLAAQMARR